MVAGFGTRVEGLFQVLVTKMPKITPWRFSQQDSFKVPRGFPRKLETLFHPSKDCNAQGPAYKQPYNRPSVSTGDWFQNS